MVLDFLRDKKLTAGIIILAMLIFILYASIQFISAFFGAAILAFIFRPLDRKLRKYMSPALSAATILVISLILVIFPLIFLINGLIDQVSLLPEQIEKIRLVRDNIEAFLPFDIDLNESQLTEQIMPFLTNAIRPLFSNLINAFAILFLLFFLLYYMILYYDESRKIILEHLPFSKKNNLKIIGRFKEVTYSIIIGTFLIAIIQGGLLAFNFYLLGIPNALFWGTITMILSFLPIIGAPIIWGPAAAILLISGQIDKGIAMIIVGILISTLDNILRPIINQRYGRIHPIVSIIGIYIGVSQFGIVGIFIGPLLIVYFLLFWKLYTEEYFEPSPIEKIKKNI